MTDNDSVEYYEATEKWRPEDVDRETHVASRCNVGAGICPYCDI
ncbi:hypothetical protein AB0A63_13810 [Lentzea sp. NPDC042327]